LAFIRDRAPLAPAAGLPEIRLHQADAASGLSRFASQGLRTPYWAYLWAGGAALARYILDHPETVAGRRVIDLGAGSGVVAIAAMLAGARAATAVDVDTNALAAVGLNAAANGVAVSTALGDPTRRRPPFTDLIAVGDLFYEAALAERVMRFLGRCAGVGVGVLIGDPGRAYLPRERLRQIAAYDVADFGDVKGGAGTKSGVYKLASQKP
jgi:predicted nicotinamide N-methyase